jgi:hydrogenase/urease accessory protein HupE
MRIPGDEEPLALVAVALMVYGSVLAVVDCANPRIEAAIAWATVVEIIVVVDFELVLARHIVRWADATGIVTYLTRQV